MRHYCTYFDRNYLARGLVLHQSLEKHSEGDFRLYVLCLDEQTESVLKSLGKSTIIPVALRDVEAWDPDLLEAKANRSTVEYYFTLSPVLPLYVLEHFDCDLITYLDADLMFFSPPEAIFDELGDKSIFTTGHRFPQRLKDLEAYGRFNVQCQSFRKSDAGLACLHRWREQCLGWCYDRFEDGKFADQKYLDEWPGLYGEHLVISQHPGIGVAPWNVSAVQLKCDASVWMVGCDPLVFYHFHDLKFLGRRWLKTGLGQYHAPISSELRSLYSAYCNHIIRATKRVAVDRLSKHDSRFSHGWTRIFLNGIRQRDLMWR